ncbi:right-handed parallel beta-helix repeat-containing protein [Kribbella sp. NBC_00662]|uniref:right-handed parallel beta-helix repeat-containing protein n=1 Tax=Kribbella sp. NBC_00662 TaxID=2975969 RepID=UPI00325383FA
MSTDLSRRTFLNAGLATAAVGALAIHGSSAFAAPAGSAPSNLTPSGTIRNLPDAFYRRPGLEGMPRIDYASLPVANVRDYGAVGDGSTSDVAAFNQALAAIRAQGGGIVYIPSGRYLFPPPPLPSNNWWFQQDIRDVHFVGEGETSVLLFHRPAMTGNTTEAPPYPSGAAWQFQTAVNVSLRDLAFQWAPLNMMRHNATATALIIRAPQSVQLLRVTVDHCQPGLLLPNARDCWMVGNTLRNGGSDAYNFGGANDCVAAYNWAEYIGDDGIANWHNSVTYPDSTAISNVRFEHNTLISMCYGRGMTLGGSKQTVAHNWIESVVGCSLFSDITTTNPATLIDAVIDDNVLVRGNLEMRPDNRILSPGGGWHGTIAIIDKVQSLTITNNSIRGSENNDITVGIDNWLPVQATSVTISGNELLGGGGNGLRVSPGTTVDGFTVDRNRVVSPGPGASIAGSTTGTSTSRNVVTHAPEITGTVDGDFTGFKVAPGTYDDPYGARRAEPSETVWREPTVRSTRGLRVANVRRFGARGDGRHDDTAAFRAALDSLPGEGGVVFVPEGRYLLRPDGRHSTFRDTRIEHHFAIAERDNIHLLGAGTGSEIVLTSPDHQGIRVIGGTGCSVSNLAVTLPSRPELRHNRSLVELTGVRDSSVTDLTLRGASGSNLLIDTSTGVRVEGITTIDANMYGIDVEGSRQVYVVGCTATDNRDGGIQVGYVASIMRDAQFVRVEGNTVSGSAEGGGILVSSGTSVRVAGNTISDTCQAGIYLWGRSPEFPMYSADITGNTVTRACTGALCVTPGAISVNSIRESAGTTEGFFSITGNTIQDAPYSGVWVGGQSPIGKMLSQINTLTVTGNVFTNVAGSNLLIRDDQRAKIVNLITA